MALESMAAGKPVVALQYAPDSEFNTVAELVGEGARSPGEYIHFADRLIRDPGERDRVGERLRERVRIEFSPARLADRYVDFLEKIRGQAGTWA